MSKRHAFIELHHARVSNLMIIKAAQILLNFMKDGKQKGDIMLSDKKLFTVKVKFNP